MRGLVFLQKMFKNSTARERTRVSQQETCRERTIEKTARERTQAPVHPEESAGAFGGEEGMAMVNPRQKASSRNR